jgi:RHS repeat-associated protein
MLENCEQILDDACDSNSQPAGEEGFTGCYDPQGNRIETPDQPEREATAFTYAYDMPGSDSDVAVYEDDMPADADRCPGLYDWTGREIEMETGLQYNRARCFDPRQGRWITGDPLGYDAADGDQFPYVQEKYDTQESEVPVDRVD